MKSFLLALTGENAPSELVLARFTEPQLATIKSTIATVAEKGFISASLYPGGMKLWPELINSQAPEDASEEMEDIYNLSENEGVEVDDATAKALERSENEYRLECNEMAVTEGYVYFFFAFKHSGEKFETRSIPVEKLFED